MPVLLRPNHGDKTKCVHKDNIFALEEVTHLCHCNRLLLFLEVPFVYDVTQKIFDLLTLVFLVVCPWVVLESALALANLAPNRFLNLVLLVFHLFFSVSIRDYRDHNLLVDCYDQNFRDELQDLLLF